MLSGCTKLVGRLNIIKIGTSIPNLTSCRNLSTPRILSFPEELFTKEISKVVSLDTANRKEILNHNISLAIDKFKHHKSDTGSASVQIAVMTEKIANLALHFAKHKKDKHSNRGFQMLVNRRHKMMQYLMKNNLQEYGRTVKVLGLTKEASHVRYK